MASLSVMPVRSGTAAAVAEAVAMVGAVPPPILPEATKPITTARRRRKAMMNAHTQPRDLLDETCALSP